MRVVAMALAMSCLAAGGLSAGSSAAPGPKGFTDGAWTGQFVWIASVQYPDATGKADAGGSFEVAFSGGVPDGTFDFLADGSGKTTDASAQLFLSVGGTIGGNAELPYLVGTGAVVLGTAQAEGIPDPIPFEFSLSADELDPFELDIRQAGCSYVSGDFAAQIAQTDAVVTSTGGSFSATTAKWSAFRSGSAGATSEEQLTLLHQLVGDGIALGLEIDTGSVDTTALQSLIDRANHFASGIDRNTACGIGNDEHFSTAIAGVMAELLSKMIAKSELFTAEEFQSAIVAGIAAGVLGSSAGSEGQQLTTELSDVLLVKLTDAIATADQAAMFAVALAAAAIGDSQLAQKAIDEADKI